MKKILIAGLFGLVTLLGWLSLPSAVSLVTPNYGYSSPLTRSPIPTYSPTSTVTATATFTTTNTKTATPTSTATKTTTATTTYTPTFTPQYTSTNTPTATVTATPGTANIAVMASHNAYSLQSIVNFLTGQYPQLTVTPVPQLGF